MSQKILSCFTFSLLLLSTQSYCMYKVSGISTRGRCVVNGTVYQGNSIDCINGQVYVDGVLQNDAGSAASSQETWKHEQHESKEFELNDNSFLTIENNMGKIDVLGRDNPKITLLISKLGATGEDLKNINADISQSNNNNLTIKTNYLKPSVRALIHYSLLVPKNKTVNFDLTNSSGNVSIENIMGKIRTQTVGGTTKLCNINGDSDIETSSGAIYAEVLGSFNGRTLSGSIKLKKNSINAPVIIKTTSGDIELCTDDFNANLDAETSMGKFNSDFPITIAKLSPWGQKRVSVMIGLGGQDVKLSSVSGDINLTKN